jgi:hypothetical protein
MKRAFELAKSKGHDIIIISDANTIYIEEITRVFQILQGKRYQGVHLSRSHESSPL